MSLQQELSESTQQEDNSVELKPDQEQQEAELSRPLLVSAPTPHPVLLISNPDKQRKRLRTMAAGLAAGGERLRNIENALLRENAERFLPTPLVQAEVLKIARDARLSCKPAIIGDGMARPAETSELWTVHTLADALQQEDAPPPWFIDGLVLADSATLVSGQPHAGKSLNWLEALLEAVAHKKVWGHFDATKIERGLFIETEDPEFVVRQRIRGFSTGLGIDPSKPPTGFYYVCPGPFVLTEAEDKLSKLLEEYKPQIVVLSTLQGLLGERNVKEQVDMAPVNAMIVRLSRKYCPIVLITHSPWDKENKRALGTVTQTANFLVTIHFEKHIKDSGETTTNVTLDSKLGMSQPQFSLKLHTEKITRPDGTICDEVRKVTYEGEPKLTAKEQILRQLETDQLATAEMLGSKFNVSARYARNVIKEHKGKAQGKQKNGGKQKENG